MSSTESEKQSRPAKKRALFVNLFFAMVNTSIAVFFLFISVWILARFRVEVLAGQEYEWPLRMKIISMVYIVVSVVMLASQLFVMLGRRMAARVLVACLAFFFAAYALEVLMAANEYGLRESVAYRLVYLIAFLVWVISNYFFWLRIRLKGVAAKS